MIYLRCSLSRIDTILHQWLHAFTHLLPNHMKENFRVNNVGAYFTDLLKAFLFKYGTLYMFESQFQVPVLYRKIFPRVLLRSVSATITLISTVPGGWNVPAGK